MAITSVINNSDGVVRFATGSYLETTSAVAFTLDIGFKPRYVRVLNETDGDKIEWNETMADAEGLKTSDTGASALITSNGITPTTHGFTI